MQNTIILKFNPDRRLPATERVALSIDYIECIVSELEIASLQRFGQTSRVYAPIARSELASRVCHALKLHISDYSPASGWILSHSIRHRCKRFFRMLRETRSVIAGQTALSVMMSQSRWNGPWQDMRDLDIYTPKDVTPQVLAYLVQYERYHIESASATGPNTETDSALPTQFGTSDPTDNSDSDDQDNTATQALLHVVNHELTASVTYLYRERDHRRVVINESSSSSTLGPVAASPTTLLVNYLTSTTLVCMYPKTTTDGVGLINPGLWSQTVGGESLIRRCRSYGFDIRDAEHDLQKCSRVTSYCPRIMRSSEDPWSFSMNFDRRCNTMENTHIRVWRARSYVPETYWTWGDWDHHEEHNGLPFVTPDHGVFSAN